MLAPLDKIELRPDPYGAGVMTRFLKKQSIILAYAAGAGIVATVLALFLRGKSGDGLFMGGAVFAALYLLIGLNTDLYWFSRTFARIDFDRVTRGTTAKALLFGGAFAFPSFGVLALWLLEFHLTFIPHRIESIIFLMGPALLSLFGFQRLLASIVRQQSEVGKRHETGP